MLVKKRFAFFLFSFLFMTGFFSGYALGAPSSLEFHLDSPSARIVAIALAGLAVLCAWLLSYADFITNLGEESIGLAGIVRWFACGFLTGLLTAVIQVHWAARLNEHNFFRSIYESCGGLMIFSLVFWLIFRRNFWTIPASSTAKTPRIFGWLIFAFGLVMLSAGLFLAAGVKTWSPLGFISIGLWLSGIGLILVSAAMLFGARLAKKGWLG